MNQWWPLLLGWPSVLFGLSLGSFGVFQKKPFRLYLAAVLILPISLYLSATPRFAGLMLLPPPALFLAGLAIKYGKINLAFTLVLSVVLLFVWLAMTVTL